MHFQRGSSQTDDTPVASPADWWSHSDPARRPTVVTAPDVRSRYYHRPWALASVVALGCAAVIVGSRMPWISGTVFGRRADLDGTTHAVTHVVGINGWLTLAGGVAGAALAGLVVLVRVPLLKALMALVTLATTGLSVLAVVRIAQRIDQTHAHTNRFVPFPAGLVGHLWVGYGLITVVAGAGVAALASLLCLSD